MLNFVNFQNTGAKPKKTMVESLLGEHSNLVNLDNIVQVCICIGSKAILTTPPPPPNQTDSITKTPWPVTPTVKGGRQCVNFGALDVERYF